MSGSSGTEGAYRDPAGLDTPAATRPSQRSRRRRSTAETLLSATLGIEAGVALFVAIAASALGAVPGWVALAGGAALIALFVAAAGVQRWTWGVWAGGVLQVVLIATGFLLPVMFVVALIFVALWVYCLVRGRQIDTARAAYEARNPEGATP